VSQLLQQQSQIVTLLSTIVENKFSPTTSYGPPPHVASAHSQLLPTKSTTQSQLPSPPIEPHVFSPANSCQSLSNTTATQSSSQRLQYPRIEQQFQTQQATKPTLSSLTSEESQQNQQPGFKQQSFQTSTLTSSNFTPQRQQQTGIQQLPFQIQPATPSNLTLEVLKQSHEPRFQELQSLQPPTFNPSNQISQQQPNFQQQPFRTKATTLTPSNLTSQQPDFQQHLFQALAPSDPASEISQQRPGFQQTQQVAKASNLTSNNLHDQHLQYPGFQQQSSHTQEAMSVSTPTSSYPTSGFDRSARRVFSFYAVPST
jgi:hypothetical protein